MKAARRKLMLVFGLSLALHATLFILLSWQRQPKAPLPTLMATLRLVADPLSSKQGAAHPVNKVALAPPKHSEPLPDVAVQPKARPKTARGMSSSAPAVMTARPTAQESATVSPLAESASASLSPPSPVANTVAASSVQPIAHVRSVDDVLATYRQHLTALFAGQHEYPRLAAMRGWEGEVRLRLKVARKGHLLGVVLDHSSGYDVLDRAALAWIEGYGDLPPLPEALNSNEISVIVPINYKLRKAA